MNADDYVTKPFSIPILLRKIAAILRRTQREDELQVISYKTLSVDVKGHHVYICKAEKGEQIEVELTQKEFEMLYVLLINKGIVLTRQKLLNMVWGEDYYGEERIVDTHIKNIRKKLGVNLISTIRGVGYRIDKEN
ncbi:Phosphate regulon transcriptional regulatory protein phoB [[Ruminococcus] torques]|nr:Phosphate regulon transcriptional regulatory protein phoB [[Ruminococcus] torques]